MPRKRNIYRRTRRAMRGGFLDSWTNWVSQSASNLWQKTKDATSSLTGSSSSTYIPPTAPLPAPVTAPVPPIASTSSVSYGGRTRRRRMKGGYKANSPTTGVSANAQTLVGGRRRRTIRANKRS